MRVVISIVFLLFSSTAAYAGCGPCGSDILLSCTLDSNLSSTGTCFTVKASNVVIDGNGYTITGNGTGSGIAVASTVVAHSGITVTNLNVTGFETGILFQGSSNSKVLGGEIHFNTIGVKGVAANNIEAANNSIHSNGQGLYLSVTSGGIVQGNTVTDNGKGIFLDAGTVGVELIGNVACGNDVDIEEVDSNIGSGNTCDIPVNWQDMGTSGCTLVCTEDSDSDTIPNNDDNCPFHPNTGQEDADGDTVGDVCDNCAGNFNPDQKDADADGTGDACDLCPDDPDKTEPLVCGCGVADEDLDDDDVLECVDNCPGRTNDQEDWDNDGEGNECDCNDGYKGDYELGADCGIFCPAPCPACVPLVENGPHSGKIDIVFVPDVDYGGDIQAFIKDAMWLVEESYFGADEIYEDRCKFNFYYYPAYGDYEPTCKKWDLPSGYSSHCSFADSAAIVFTGGGRACSGSVFSLPPDSKKTPVHELSHKMFGHRDEYAADGSYKEHSIYPHVYESEANCVARSQTPGDCREFCPDFRYYPDDAVQIQLCKDWWLDEKGEVDAPYCSCTEYAVSLGMDPGFCTSAGPDPVPEVWINYYTNRGITDTSTLRIRSPYWCNWRGAGVKQCCGNGWWKADPNGCYMRSGTYYGPDCHERTIYKLNQWPDCTNPGEDNPFQKAMVMIYLQKEFDIILDDVFVTYGQTPDHKAEEREFLVRQVSSQGVSLQEIFMDNPLEFRLEDGLPEEELPFDEFDEPTIYMGEETTFNLVLPMLDHSRFVKILRASENEVIGEYDLAEAILAFCKDHPRDEQCQISDLDNDGSVDSEDNCPLDPNDQQDSDGDRVGDSCDNCVDVFNPAQEDTDGNGIGDACEPSDLKRTIIKTLKDRLPSGDRLTDKSIVKAIKHIKNSLNAEYWDSNVTLTEKGNRVFTEEKLAVKELASVKSIDVTNEINGIVRIDGLLARIEYDAAAARLQNCACEKVEKKASGRAMDSDCARALKAFDKARKEMGKAEEASDRGNFAKTIDHYKKAWRHARRAIQHLIERFSVGEREK